MKTVIRRMHIILLFRHMVSVKIAKCSRCRQQWQKNMAIEVNGHLTLSAWRE